jgi:hypothetical protein
MIPVSIPVPPPMEAQLASLRVAFPGWEIIISRRGIHQWFEASRPWHEPGTCVVVTSSARRMWLALNEAQVAGGSAV